jgi:hypothetical protein
VGEDGARAASYGWSRYEDVRAAALAAGARPAEGPQLDALGAVRRFGRMATAEVAAVCDMPEPPAAAELWRLHVGWQLGRVPVLCGELWEAA